MKRSGTIAVIAVTAGVLVAGSAAAVAVVNAGASAPEQPTVAMVVDPAAVTAPAATPSFAPAPLPDIVLPSEGPTSRSLISRSAAQAAVLDLVGGDVLSVAKTERGGYDAFAVAVRRADGSTVTGYVDRASGVVFDWTQKAAPAVQSTDERDDDSREGASGARDEEESESGEHKSEHEDVYEHEQGHDEDDD